jgi:phosphoribosylglycinamide formyltransferase-1
VSNSEAGSESMRPTAPPLKLGILVSGRGTNLQAVIDAISKGELNGEIKLVVCNHGGAQAVERAARAGIPVEVYELKGYASRLAKQRAIADRLEAVGIDLVVCAGWDRVLKPEFISRFAGRVINVHPSLLPAFGGGLHAIEDACRYGVKVTGCTVHFVTEEVDAGPVISQAVVEVEQDDTVQTLAEKIHIEEHRLLVEAIKLYSEGKLKVNGRKVEQQTREA